ncbi:MAG: hypothetical protein KKF44_00775, partial [Nanoarchaeota archaeon]|nr:hypothetical protein [Nanoarchaeota archaeon]
MSRLPISGIIKLDELTTPGNCVTLLKNILLDLNENYHKLKKKETAKVQEAQEAIPKGDAPEEIRLLVEITELGDKETADFGETIIALIYIIQAKFDDTLLKDLFAELEELKTDFDIQAKEHLIDERQKKMFEAFVNALIQLEEATKKDELVLLDELYDFRHLIEKSREHSNRSDEQIKVEIEQPANDLIEELHGLQEIISFFRDRLAKIRQTYNLLKSAEKAEDKTQLTAALMAHETFMSTHLNNEVITLLKQIYPRFVQMTNYAIIFTFRIYDEDITMIEGLLEKAKEAVSEDEAKDMGKKFLKGDFNLIDLYEQMQTMKKMG